MKLVSLLCFTIVINAITAPAFALTESEGANIQDRAIVLVHDWFGVTPFYTEYAAALSSLGYEVDALDLYDGASATTHKDAFALMSALDANKAGEQIDDAIRAAGRDSDFVAVIAFSMGVPHALRAAGRQGEIVDTAIVYYGDALAEPELLEAIGDPVLGLFAGADGFAGPNGAAADAAAFAKAGEAAKTGAEIHVYPGAAHAFAQPLFNQGTTYDADLRAAAWQLTIDFLDRQANKQNAN